MISVLQLEFITIKDNVTRVECVAQLLGMSERIPCMDLKFIYLNHLPIAYVFPEGLQSVLVFFNVIVGAICQQMQKRRDSLRVPLLLQSTHQPCLCSQGPEQV